MIGTSLGPYQVVAKLGEGGMGAVYRARDTKLDRDVAIKVLPESFANDPDRLMRFEREAKTLAALNHPNIAGIYGIEQHALVMELVEGEDLSARIARGAIPIDEALPIAKQIAEALEAAHEQGIIHRDLKPANIKVRPDGTVKVLDFGLAKAIGPSEGDGFSRRQAEAEASALQTITSPAMTQAGIILGTAAYMSPEQARGKVVDRRSDTWAFGAVFYEMLTGRRVFDGDEMSDVLAAVLRQPVDWAVLPAETPPSVRRLLRRCLEKDRRERPGDMATARLEISEALAGDGMLLPPGGRPSDQRHWRWLAGGLALLSVALSLALMGWARPATVPNHEVLRFALVDDPNVEMNFGTQPFAVSPDGKTVVFNATAGATGLWARSLDEPVARFLANTDGGGQPAISPDGQWVAFVVANHIIRKVRLGGGAATTVVSIDDVTRALAWASDDEIVFEKVGSASGIQRVSADGGEPQLLIPLAGDERGHYVPTVLREARVVIYATQRDSRTLAAFSLVDGRRHALNLDGERALGMIDGHLVYVRTNGALMAVPFDARALRVTGEPRLLEPRVSPSRFGPLVTLAENGTLVSLPMVSPLSRLMLLEGTGAAVQHGDARAFDSPRLSPDGHRIAVGIADGDGANLWMLDRATSAATRVTRGGPASLKLESWTPDGQSLVHTRGAQLWTVRVNGTEDAHQLVPIDGSVLGASLFPGGRFVAVLRVVREGGGNLNREELVRVGLGPDHTAIPIVTSKSSGNMLRGLDPRTSPDGRFVALVDRNARQVHIRSVDGGVGLQVSDAGGSVPVWGHDNASLYYRTAAGTVKASLGTDPVLAVIARQLMPRIPVAGSLHDISADGKTWLITEPIAAAPKVLVTVNWAADVRRQLAPRKE